jgi:hypothetical protein
MTMKLAEKTTSQRLSLLELADTRNVTHPFFQVALCVTFFASTSDPGQPGSLVGPS